MKGKRIRAALAAVTFIGVISTTTSAIGQGIPVIDGASIARMIADRAAQAAEFAQQLAEMERQYAQLVTQYQHMLNQAKTISDIRNINDIHRLTESLQRLQQIYGESRALAGQVEDFDREFQEQFPGYEEYLATNGYAAMREGYRRWDDHGTDAMRTAMRSAGANVSTIDSEDQMLGDLIRLSQDSNTQTQAIQVGNEISGMMVQQVQQLRLMLNDQIQSQSFYTAQQIERQAMEDAAFETFWGESKIQSGHSAGRSYRIGQ